MVYNALRFDSPFEFGFRYMLVGEDRHQTYQYFSQTYHYFSMRYLWFNFLVYFLQPAPSSGPIPLLGEITVPHMPAGYQGVEHPVGILANIPLVWLAMAVPLAWCSRSAKSHPMLYRFFTALTLLFGICALTLCLFCSAISRYEVDFLPSLMLLAVIGILSLERALVDRPVWRLTARLGWGLLLAFSVSFNLLDY